MVSSLTVSVKKFYLCILVFSIFSIELQASMPEKDYLAQLKFANDKIQKKKDSLSHSGALSASVIKRLYGRYYQVGDWWEVAAWQWSHSMMRMTGELQQLENKTNAGTVFHYQVIKVQTGSTPEVTLQITQTSQLGLKEADPRVEKLLLRMNDRLLQDEKTYYFHGENQGRPASNNGIHTSISSLELFPLDVPEISLSEGLPATHLPELPVRIQETANRTQWNPNLSQSQEFKQDDFFGRPIDVLWQHGNPWPSFIQTSNGISILIHNGING